MKCLKFLTTDLTRIVASSARAEGGDDQPRKTVFAIDSLG